MKTRQIPLRECVDAWARGENTFVNEKLDGFSTNQPIAKPGVRPRKGEWSAEVFNIPLATYFVEVPPSANELREATVRDILDKLVEFKLSVEYNGGIYVISRVGENYKLGHVGGVPNNTLQFSVSNVGSIKIEPHPTFGIIAVIELWF